MSSLNHGISRAWGFLQGLLPKLKVPSLCPQEASLAPLPLDP